MQVPILLSAENPKEALKTLTYWMNNEPVTILLIIGENEVAQKVMDKMTNLLNSNDPFYKGVVVIQVPEIKYILEKLKTLKVNPRINLIPWNTIDEYVMISISNVYHNIGDFVLASKYTNRPIYYIERLIFKALAFDKELSI